MNSGHSENKISSLTRWFDPNMSSATFCTFRRFRAVVMISIHQMKSSSMSDIQEGEPEETIIISVRSFTFITSKLDPPHFFILHVRCSDGGSDFTPVLQPSLYLKLVQPSSLSDLCFLLLHHSPSFKSFKPQ